MKAQIHPQWYPAARVTCACGNSFTVGATVPEIRVEICSHCHPFFTGKMAYVDTLGRVERFQQKQKAAAAQATQLSEKKKKKQEREASLRTPKSLKEMLLGLR